MIEIYLLEQLIAVDQYKSFNTAAKKLNLTQPTITRSMQKIEQEFGIPLFIRKNNKVELNETGKIAVKYAKRILKEEKEMFQNVLSAASLSIGFSAPGPSYIIEKASTSKQISNTTQFFDHGTLIEALRDKQYQIVITDQKCDDLDLYCIPFTQEKLYLSTPINHPLIQYSSISFAQLKGNTFLMAQDIGVWKKIVYDNIPEAKFLLQSSVDDLSLIVLSSSLLSFSTNITHTLFHKNEQRHFIPFSDEEATVSFYLYCLKEQYHFLSSFIQQILDTKDSYHL